MNASHTTIWALAAAGAILIAGCGDDAEDGNAQATPASVVAAIADNADLSGLNNALRSTGLDEALAGDGPFTVFAPTDAAFAALPDGALDDSEAVATILQGHVIADMVTAAEVVTLDEAQTLSGSTIAIEVIDGEVILNGTAKVTMTDIETANGVVHIIDAVLVPEEAPSNSIADIVIASDDFDTLEDAVVAAGLAGTLGSAGPFTVFAPTDDAFANLPEGALDELLADTDALTAVLTYHAIGGEVDSAAVVGLSEATTLNGATISIEVVDGDVILNGSAKVTMVDIMADNGIIHVIDTVLLPPAPAMDTITDIVVGSDDFDTLEAAVVAADLADTLAGDGPFTVFAPTDAAFDALPEGALDGLLADADALTDVLTYHVVSGEVDAATVVGLTEATALNGDTISIEVVDGDVILNGNVKVTTVDIMAANGIIHVIDAVLMPPVPSNTITDIVVGNDDFDTLEAAVVAAGLAETLAGDGPFTVFAPTDAAFEALPDGALDALLADTDALTDVLTYHVVAGEVDAATVVGLSDATALNGDTISIEVVDGDVFLNGTTKVTVVDVMADNGIIHIIDAVLMPPTNTITDIVVGNPDFSTLETAVLAADLAETLAGDGPFTVFAPTDEAFAALPDGVLDGLLADIPALTDILTYHVVSGSVDAATVVTLPRATALNNVDVDIKIVGGAVMLNDTVMVTTTDIAADNGIIHVIDAVLTPPPTIAEIVSDDANFSTLLTAVTTAGLATTLNDDGPFTVFAPTNAAFAAIPATDLSDLLADVPALTNVLLYHVADGKLYSEAVVELTMLMMKNSVAAAVAVDMMSGAASIGGATISTVDIRARNGVIHVIDSVLLP